MLINKGVDFNVSNYLVGILLINVCKMGYNDVVELLLEYGVNVFLIDIDGKMLLGVVWVKKYLIIIK